MELSNKILSDIAVYMKYAKYQPELERREVWSEIVQRNKEMHLKKYPELSDTIEGLYENFVIPKKVLPSMRSMQFAGKPIEVSPNRVYNCGYAPIEHIDVFSEIMFLLLGGTGIGFSVQKDHVEKLPEIRKPNPSRKRRYLIGDSIEGWADAVKVLLKSYTGSLSSTPVFDFSDIRQKGERLVTSGGKAPGPEPLRLCLTEIEAILREKDENTKLSPVEAYDMVCHIADAVLAGGIRRAALICLFNADDEEMIASKSGSWWEKNPQRGRSNNSAVLVRHKITEGFFSTLWNRIEKSGSGEPGVYFTNDTDWGTNPCVEIALRPYQFCNLTEVNVSNVESQEDLNQRVRAAAILGTLQAGYTDFHYLREVWKRTTEKDALLGVSMTGIADGAIFEYDLTEASQVVKDTNVEISSIIGINPAARTTCVKPAGTTSLALGTSSGIHARHNDYYIRRIRVGKNEAIYTYLLINHPELLEDDYFRPHDTAVISIPQKSPEGSIMRTESALDTLSRVKKFSTEWVYPGHVNGNNKHNVSCTISVKDTEWEEVGNWMWKNRDYYNGIAVLPYDGGSYIQAPFEDCTKETYDKMMESLTSIDMTKIVEVEDNTDLSGELACSGGACEVV